MQDEDDTWQGKRAVPTAPWLETQLATPGRRAKAPSSKEWPNEMEWPSRKWKEECNPGCNAAIVSKCRWQMGAMDAPNEWICCKKMRVTGGFRVPGIRVLAPLFCGLCSHSGGGKSFRTTFSNRKGCSYHSCVYGRRPSALSPRRFERIAGTPRPAHAAACPTPQPAAAHTGPCPRRNLPSLPPAHVIPLGDPFDIRPRPAG